ncbi:MAG: hypothetical protein ACRDOK_18820 [Streptosporangiaceae bacterium]
MGSLIGRGRYARETYPESAGTGGGGGAPFGRLFWIDGTAAHPGTGSDEAPFQTPQDWATATGVPLTLADASTMTVGVMTPATVAEYTGNLNLPAYRNMELRTMANAVSNGVGGSEITGNITINNVAGGGAVAPPIATYGFRGIHLIGDLTVTDDNTVVSFLFLGSLSFTSAQSQIIVGNVIGTGASKLEEIILNNFEVDGNIDAPTAAILSFGTIFRLGTITCVEFGGFLQSNIESSVVSSSEININGCTMPGGSSLSATTTIEILDTTFQGVVAISAASSVTFDGPSYLSFLNQGGTVAAGISVLVIGGYRGAPVEGAPLVSGALTIVSLDGGGASPGFTHGGNHYTLSAATVLAVNSVVEPLTDGGPGETIAFTIINAATNSPNTFTVKDANGVDKLLVSAGNQGFAVFQNIAGVFEWVEGAVYAIPA